MKPKIKNKRLTIGFSALGDFRPIIGQEIFNGINKACADFDINIINFIGEVYKPLNENQKKNFHYKKVTAFFNVDNIDGLISWSSSYYLLMTNEEIYRLHRNLYPLPVVSIGMPIDGIPSLYIDDKMGIKKIMTHLITKHNKKNIAFIGIEKNNHFSYIERFNAYLETLKEFNIPFDEMLYTTVNELENKDEAKKALDLLLNERELFQKNKIDTIVTLSDRIANNITDILHEKGINIPGDISVTGFNNHLEGMRSIPALTTIEPNFFKLGYQSVETLIDIINGEKKELKTATPCELVIRESCGCDYNNYQNISKAANHNKTEILSIEQQKLITDEIFNIIKRMIGKADIEFAKRFFESILYDIDKESSFKSIYLIKQNLLDYTNITENKLIRYQEVITGIKSLFTSYFQNDHNKILKLENIFHRAKSVIDSEYSYLIRFQETGQYGINSFIELSSDLREVSNLGEIKNILKNYFKDASIENAFLFLFEEPKENISSSELAFALSNNSEINLIKLIKSEAGIIKLDNIKDFAERHTYIFELLTYKNKYLGFLLMEMGHANIPLYDTLREIISPSIFFVLQNKNKNPLILESMIKKFNIKENKKSRSINSKELLEYLSNNAHVMTDVDLISKELDIPKSSLMKKVKSLTGYPIQKLHEILKIEKAKELLTTTGNSIAEISLSLGYKDQLYFSRVFKKHTGVSPKKWVETNINK